MVKARKLIKYQGERESIFAWFVGLGFVLGLGLSLVGFVCLVVLQKSRFAYIGRFPDFSASLGQRF